MMQAQSPAPEPDSSSPSSPSSSSEEWWLVRCPSCRAVLRVREFDLASEEVIACSVCQELFRSPELFNEEEFQAKLASSGNSIASESAEHSPTPSADGTAEQISRADTSSQAPATVPARGKKRRKHNQAKKEQLNPDEYTKTLERERRKKSTPKFSTSVLFLVIFLLGSLLIGAFAIRNQIEDNRRQKAREDQELQRIERDESDIREAEKRRLERRARLAQNSDEAQNQNLNLGPKERFLQKRESQFQGQLSAFETLALELADEWINSSSTAKRLELAQQNQAEFNQIRSFLDSEQAPKGLSSYESLSSSETSSGIKQVNIYLLDELARPFRLVFTEAEGVHSENTELDLAASFAIGGVSWPKLDSAQGATQMRVVIEEHDYYNFNYRDNKRWKAWRLSHPYFPERWYAYSEIGSSTHTQMMQSLELDERTLAGLGQENTQELRKQWTLLIDVHEGDATRGQFLIRELVSESWLSTSEKPDQANPNPSLSNEA